MQGAAQIGFDLLHSQTISRASRERLEDFSSVVSEAWVEALRTCDEPAFGDEAFAVGEVV
jgi:hypothetical protein